MFTEQRLEAFQNSLSTSNNLLHEQVEILTLLKTKTESNEKKYGTLLKDDIFKINSEKLEHVCE